VTIVDVQKVKTSYRQIRQARAMGKVLENGAKKKKKKKPEIESSGKSESESEDRIIAFY